MLLFTMDLCWPKSIQSQAKRYPVRYKTIPFSLNDFCAHFCATQPRVRMSTKVHFRGRRWFSEGNVPDRGSNPRGDASLRPSFGWQASQGGGAGDGGDENRRPRRRQGRSPCPWVRRPERSAGRRGDAQRRVRSTEGRWPRANPRLSAVAPAKADGDASLRLGFGWQASRGAERGRANAQPGILHTLLSPVRIFCAGRGRIPG